MAAAVDQESMLEQRREVGSVKDDPAHFQHQIDACDAALRRLTGLVPPPYHAIEALLLAKAAAEGQLSQLSQNHVS